MKKTKVTRKMTVKYNATITVRGKSHGVTSTKRIENKSMPFIVKTAKEMADDVNHMAFTNPKRVSISVETLDDLKYKAIVSSINIKFKKVK